MEVHVGCCGFPVDRKRYQKTFRLVEVQETFYQPPRLKTARRWREEAPDRFVFALKAWQLVTHDPSSPTYRRLAKPIPESLGDRYGAFRPTEEVLAAWETTAAVARALQAQWVVFQSPASFTPTPENKANMGRFFESIDRDALRFAWEPRGPWEEDDVAGLCADLDLTHAVDPFLGAPAPGSTRYFRLHGKRGSRAGYGEDDFYRLLDFIEPSTPTWILFNNLTPFDDGKAFLRFLETEG